MRVRFAGLLLLASGLATPAAAQAPPEPPSNAVVSLPIFVTIVSGRGDLQLNRAAQAALSSAFINAGYKTVRDSKDAVLNAEVFSSVYGRRVNGVAFYEVSVFASLVGTRDHQPVSRAKGSFNRAIQLFNADEMDKNAIATLVERLETGGLNSYVAEVRRQEEARLQRDAALEQRAFDFARRVDSAGSWRDFLSRFPQSPHVEARSRLAELTDEPDWQAAVRDNTAQAYGVYLGSHATSPHAKEAGTRRIARAIEAGDVDDAKQWIQISLANNSLSEEEARVFDGPLTLGAIQKSIANGDFDTARQEIDDAASKGRVSAPQIAELRRSLTAKIAKAAQEEREEARRRKEQERREAREAGERARAEREEEHRQAHLSRPQLVQACNKLKRDLVAQVGGSASDLDNPMMEVMINMKLAERGTSLAQLAVQTGGSLGKRCESLWATQVQEAAAAVHAERARRGSPQWYGCQGGLVDTRICARSVQEAANGARCDSSYCTCTPSHIACVP